MLWLSAMFAAGIAVFSFLSVSIVVGTVSCVMFGAAALYSARTKYATLLISIAFLAAGGIAYKVQTASITPNRIRSVYDSDQIASGEPVEITGSVSGALESTVDGFFIRITTDLISDRGNTFPASGTVRLFAPINTPEMFADYERLAIRPGLRVRVAVELDRDDGYRNPDVISRKTILDWQDIDATGTIKSPLLIEVIGQNGPNVTSFVFGIREILIAKFRELFSPRIAGVMIASLLGNKHFLDKETAEVFREGGTFHILVISGLHITFIGGLAALIVGLFTPRRGFQFALVCSFLWLYTIAVGAEVPVVRASLMFTVLWFAIVVHRTGSLANALGTCGLILLAWRPSDLFTPSFQLTFVSVTAIVLAGFPLIKTLRSIGEWIPDSSEPFPARVPVWLKRFCETLYWNPRRWEIEAARNIWSAKLFKTPLIPLVPTAQKTIAYLFEGIVVSFIVQLAMLPLVVHYFHRVTPGSVLLNIWVGVFVALESFASLFAILFSYLSDSLPLPFVLFTEYLHWFLVVVPGYLTGSQWLSFRVPVYSGYEVWLYGFYFACVIVLAVMVFRWDPFSIPATNRGMRRNAMLAPVSVIGLLLFSIVIVVHPFSEPRPDGSLHVEFLDVGQGDSIFITFPNGATMLVDAGGRPSYRDDDDEPFEPDLASIGESVVSEFLWGRGYSRIDTIVATHADADHIQGLSDIARNFRIGEAWFGTADNGNDADTVRLAKALDTREVPRGSLSRGDRFEIGGVVIEVLNPPSLGAVTRSENDCSVVVRLTFGERSFLLTGDIEKLTEAELVAGTKDLRSDIVKVPHHGSKTSSTQSFVDLTRPRFAIISVGRRSIFGHPHREVVERWRAAGADVMTTGDKGTISFVTDGNDLTIRHR